VYSVNSPKRAVEEIACQNKKRQIMMARVRSIGQKSGPGKRLILNLPNPSHPIPQTLWRAPWAQKKSQASIDVLRSGNGAEVGTKCQKLPSGSSRGGPLMWTTVRMHYKEHVHFVTACTLYTVGGAPARGSSQHVCGGWPCEALHAAWLLQRRPCPSLHHQSQVSSLQECPACAKSSNRHSHDQ